MKQKFIIVLVIQTILIGMFFIYALVQRQEAVKHQELAVKQAEQAIKVSIDLNKEIEKLKEEIKNCRQQ